MLLTIDVGNTHVKLALHEGERLVGTWRATTDRSRTADEWGVYVERFLAMKQFSLGQVRGCAIVSGVAPVTEALREMSRQYLGGEPLVASIDLDLGIEIDYPQPREVGADRLVNAVAARAEYGAPVVVVDLGTATNFDVVDRRGAFVGGLIAPGLESSLNALVQRAPRLFGVPLEPPPGIIGRSTTEAIQSGVMWGYISLLEGVAARLRQELGEECTFIGTGGLAARLAPHTALFTAVDPQLTVKGLRLLWERNRQGNID